MSRTDLDQILTKGTVLLLETGEYSDYSVENPLVILMDFSKRKVAEEYRIYCALGGEEPDPGYFGAWLITQGYVEDLSRARSLDHSCN